MKGIDISEFQPNVDYKKLKEQGIEFAIIRCGYGKNSWQKDSKFEEHYKGCKEAGLRVGAYLFSYANTIDGAMLEASNCISFIQGKSFELPIFYDVEDNDTTGKASRRTITSMCDTFCKKLQEAGFQAGVYANLYWFNTKIYAEELTKYYIWLAEWNTTMDATFKVDIWQYSNEGNVEGIKGRVDMNESYINDFPKPTPIPVDQCREYHNGSTKEAVYTDTNLTQYIGYLNAYEVCDCLGIYKDRAMVRYKIDNTDNYKIGFVKWLGGVS